jgi:hypothetical protein
MNKLSHGDRAHILHLLCEGSSIRAVTRLTGASLEQTAMQHCRSMPHHRQLHFAKALVTES